MIGVGDGFNLIHFARVSSVDEVGGDCDCVGGLVLGGCEGEVGGEYYPGGVLL